MSVSGRLLRLSARSRKRRRVAGSVLRAAAPLLPRVARPTRPVFVLGSPRSGTTALFDVLRTHPGLRSLDGESHLLWEVFHGPERPGWTSHEVPPGAIGEHERRVLWWAVARLADGRTYLDKSPRNCFRVLALDSLFPDARFVFLKRDGRAAVSSLITGWRSEASTFGGVSLPRPIAIDGYDGTEWRFVVPPGWEAYARGRTLAEVCAFQWVSTNEAVLSARDRIDPHRWIELAYEELVAAPRERVADVVSRLGLAADESVARHAAELDQRVSKVTVTPPRRDKWRDENPDEIRRVLPVIAPTMARLGYPVEPLV